MTGTSDRYRHLLAEALRLAISLDSFRTFDWAERLGPAVLSGNQKLRELEREQQSLTLSPGDEATLDWLIEAIHERLIFLERLNAQISPPNPAKLIPGAVRAMGR